MIKNLVPQKQGKPLPPLEEQGTLHHILHNDAFAAVLLLTASSLAFYCANSSVEFLGMPLKDFYLKLWQMDFGIAIHTVNVTQSLHHWINDGLMAIFFFIVGLEIKREMMIGELSSIRKATLPIAAALGGMLVPAAIFAAVNYGTDGAHGWGIPMATDIAFAVGVMGLLSKRVPASLAVFLMALAIVDDLGAVVVIALFYTDTIAAGQLLSGLGLIGFSFLLSVIGIRSAVVYTMLFILIWLNFLQSGVHATIAGVLFAFTIPLDGRYDPPVFAERIGELMRRFQSVEAMDSQKMVSARQQRVIRAIENECIYVEAPLQRIENKLHPITAFIIMPIFAFANAGVAVDFAHISEQVFSTVSLGVILGLLVGKQVGITLFSWIVVQLKMAELPTGISWKQIYAASCLGSIGFTMSLFIAELAYAGGGHGVAHAAAVAAESVDAHVMRHLPEAKIGVLVGSLIAGIYGITVLFFVTEKPAPGAVTRGHH
jgi:NhaA family Na+:H+ antiporter